ncbi:hypothetical protein LCGC14_2914920, partial [marine sediment metagenome]
LRDDKATGSGCNNCYWVDIRNDDQGIYNDTWIEVTETKKDASTSESTSERITHAIREAIRIIKSA